MKALAQLCCLVLMLLGLAFIASGIVSGWSGASGGLMYVLGRDRWLWGMAAVFAGVVGTALLNIAEALGHRAGLPTAAKPEPKSE